jgi:hypothetical protein
MKVLAICIKTYIQEDDLQEFLDGTRESLSQESIMREGKEYLVIEKYYNKKYFRLVESAS